jgi:hypothetical protein
VPERARYPYFPIFGVFTGSSEHVCRDLFDLVPSGLEDLGLGLDEIIEGNGVFTELAVKNGMQILTEKDIENKKFAD